MGEWLSRREAASPSSVLQGWQDGDGDGDGDGVDDGVDDGSVLQGWRDGDGDNDVTMKRRLTGWC